MVRTQPNQGGRIKLMNKEDSSNKTFQNERSEGLISLYLNFLFLFSGEDRVALRATQFSKKFR